MALARFQPTTLFDSLSIQSRVVGALLMREILTRFGRHNLGFMWLFLEPMLFTLGVTALWYSTKSLHGSTLPIVGFAITGYSSVLIWRNCANRCVHAIEPNLSLMFHRNVRVIDLFASRILLELAGATISLIGISTVFISAGWMSPPSDLLMMTSAWLLLAWFGAALALTVGALAERSQVVDRVWHTVTYLLFPLSGAATLVDWLPPAAREIVLWLPMVHGVEFLRHGYYGDLVTTHEDPGYLVLCNIALSFSGLALIKLAGQRVEAE